MIHWEPHSSCDLYGHISLIVMGGVGSYLPVPGVSTLVVSVVLDSRCSVVRGGAGGEGTSLVLVMCSSLVATEGQLSNYGICSTLVLVVLLLSSCDVLGRSSLGVLCLGESSLVVEL